MAAVDIDNHHLVPLESITWRWRSHCSLLAQKMRRRFLFGGSMEYATPPSPRLSRAGKQVQPASRSTPRSADTATLRTLERRIAELENLTTSQSRELQIQFERIAQLQADCDILRIRFIKP
jgi:hypothetical protein